MFGKPTLNEASKNYIDSIYQAILLGDNPPGDKAEYEIFKVAFAGLSLVTDDSPVLATAVAIDIQDTFLNFPEDLKRISPELVQKTDNQGQVLKVGRKLIKWTDKHGRKALYEDAQPYSPEAAAMGAAWLITRQLQLEKRRDFRKFVSLVTVPPAFRPQSS